MAYSEDLYIYKETHKLCKLLLGYSKNVSKIIRFGQYSKAVDKAFAALDLVRRINSSFDVIKKWNRTENPSKEQTEKFVIQVNSLFGHLVHRHSYGIRWLAWKDVKHKDKIYCVNMKKIIEFKNKKL